MPKATIEFELDTERVLLMELMRALDKERDVLSVVQEMDQWLRNAIKHGISSTGKSLSEDACNALQSARDELHRIVRESDIPIL